MMYDLESGHLPKHLKQYKSHMSHCCFAGCTPRGCPGRCCIQEFGHRADCPSNEFRKFDEAEHDAYVAAGLRKHLAETPEPYYDPSRDWGTLPPLRTRRCGCGDIARYPNGCGPSGCQNRPA